MRHAGKLVVTALALTAALAAAQEGPADPKPVPPNRSAGKAPEVPGFTFLREETFAAGGQRHRVKIYRCEAFARALGLGAGKTDLACEFVLVPKGSFLMGSPASEAGRSDDEGPQHRVTVTAFLLARTEVTQQVWEKIAGNNPSKFRGPRRPLETFAWNDGQSFLKKTGLRLPSEAEWEYACRSGTQTPFAFGKTITTDQANYNGEEATYGASKGVNRKQTVDVGTFKPNAFGLHDMHGNVEEWCEDTWRENYRGAPTTAWPPWTENPTGFSRIVRGGHWGAVSCRSACRFGGQQEADPFYGLRPARSVP